jgi:uncharacterized protein (TIGR04255 family)
VTVDAKPIPTKLKNDAIVEVAFEIRFTTSTIPEVLFGRISEFGPWVDFSQSSLPISQIPLTVRQADPNLRFQPIFAMINEGDKRAVRVGSNTIAYTRGMPYVGWERLKLELRQVIDALFEKAQKLRVERLGLRYLNALRRDLHGIQSITDLDLSLEIENERISDHVNINLTFDPAGDTTCTVRIATPEFVQGLVPPGTSVYVDVDVFTNEEGFVTTDRNFVESWIERAHQREKEQFFRLLPPSTIESLRET